jgi:hypothetical protein
VCWPEQIDNCFSLDLGYGYLMSVSHREKIANFLLSSERESAEQVTSSFLTTGSIVINTYILSQLFFLSGPITSRHILASILLLASLAISIFLMARLQTNIPIMINQIALLVLPIYLDNSTVKPWISYGLMCAITVIFAGMIQVKQLLIVTVIVIPILQYGVAKLDLNGVSDSSDLLLLNSFFSSVWIITAGIGVYLARKSYYTYCDRIDKELSTIQKESVEIGNSASQLNLNDHKNISLHGTVLNTLISYTHMDRAIDFKSRLANDLSADMNKIYSKKQVDATSRAFTKTLEDNLAPYLINIKVQVESNLIIEKRYSEKIIEIIREIVLNTKKHTNSSQIEISITAVSQEFVVSVQEVLELSLSSPEMDRKINAAKSSKTLKRLMDQGEIPLRIQSNTDRNRLEYEFQVSTRVRSIDTAVKISKLRSLALTENFRLICGISVVYSYLAIIGFSLIAVPIYVVFVLLASIIFLSLELFGSKSTTWRPMLSQLLLLTLIPYITLTTKSCENLLYTPWLFNAIFGSVMFGLVLVQHSLFKWIPILIFIAENSATRWFFPNECQNLLDGSTPGFIFIVIFGLLMGNARRKNIALDTELNQLLLNQIESSKQVAELVAYERGKIVNALEEFIQSLTLPSVNGERLKSKIELLIQKIRVFLICSEFYSSTTIQSLYKFAIARIDQGLPTKISIYAPKIDDYYFFDFELLEELSKKAGNQLVEMVILDNEKLTLDFLVDGQELATYNLTY